MSCLKPIAREDIPAINQPTPKRPRTPESAFAERCVADFLASGQTLVEICDIPRAYNTTKVYAGVGHAAWKLCSNPVEIKAIRRGGRIFLERRDPWGRRQR